MKQLKNKGITLIALVITIIVLLILAAVSIATLTGENGILNKAMRASEESKLERYKEEINLIIIDEIAERKIKSKTEALIVSLENKIKEKEWVEGTKKCNEEGIEQQPVEENNRLIVNTKDGYEIIIEVDNLGIVAKIIEINKTGEKEEEDTEEEKTDLEMSITNNKITEGTNINIKINSTRKIQKIEVKAQDIALYSQDNIGTTSYDQNIGIEQLSNLGQLAFYDDVTITLEATTTTQTKTSKSIEKVKNYTISTATQLNQLASIVNSGNSLQNETIVQLADIDVNPGKWTENADGTTTFKNNPSEWQGIGSTTYDYDTNAVSNTKSFAGIYDGKKHKIEGVYIANNTRDQVGLFAINDGSVKNIILKNSIIKGRYNIGGIVSGNNEGATIENCENYADVSGTREVGGICGWSQGTIYISKNYGQISSRAEVGWKLEAEHIGGIVGWGDNNITKCENYGKIISTTSGTRSSYVGVGGVVGSGEKGILNECKNEGIIISGEIDAGGIIGSVVNRNGNNFIISKCYNVGNVEGKTSGGIVAWGNYIQIQDCYNKGIVKGNYHTGGIIGWAGSNTTANGSLTNCYNIGKVSGTPEKWVGGVLGRYNDLPTLTNCYNLNNSSVYAVGDDNGAWGNLGNIWEGHIETKTEEGMKGLASTLGSNWTEDTNNVNNGYPILK
jgi:hypothetical protein